MGGYKLYTIKPTREVIKFSICLRFIHTEATMSQREQRKLLFLSSRSQRNWMQACNIKHFANWRFGNYISNCRAISKEISSGTPPNSAIPKVQFLLWGLPARTKMNVGPIGRQKTDKCISELPLNSLGQGWKTQRKCTILIFRAGFVTKIEEGRDDDWVDWKRGKEIGQMMKENWTNLSSFNPVSYEVGKVILQRCPFPSMVKR